MKWILSDVLTGSNVIRDALSTVIFRTGTASDGNKITGLLSVLVRNMEMYLNWGFYIVGLILVLWLLYLVFKNRKTYWKREILQQRFVILSVIFYPVAWYFLTQNHSEEHYMFTCKNIAIIVFAIICAVTYKTE